MQDESSKNVKKKIPIREIRQNIKAIVGIEKDELEWGKDTVYTLQGWTDVICYGLCLQWQISSNSAFQLDNNNNKKKKKKKKKNYTKK